MAPTQPGRVDQANPVPLADPAGGAEAWPAGAPEVAGSVPGAARANADEVAGLREELERRMKGAESRPGAADGGSPPRS